MSVIRGSALTGYRELVAELGGDAEALLRAAGVEPRDVGVYDVFIPYMGHIRAVESAAVATGAADFGRQLALRQGIDILGPVGVAARTAASVGEAFVIAERYLSAYGPAIGIGLEPGEDPERVFFEFRILMDRLPRHPQTIELALGVALRIFRFLWGSQTWPLIVHLPHEPLSPRREYREFYGCTPRFAEPRSGFTIRAVDLQRPLSQDRVAHEAVVRYLDSVVTSRAHGVTWPVRDLVRRLLPTGAATLDVIARQLALHPKTLQRRLAAEGTTFAAVVDQLRKEAAERYLRDTEMSLSHLARELGYAEQSVLTRSCRRWFGSAPMAVRQAAAQGRSPVAQA